MDDTHATRQRTRWISPLGWGLAAALVVAFVVIPVGLGRLLTDRLTVYNRTTVTISIATDPIGADRNHVGACDSSEFRWKQDGSRSGWTPADGGSWPGGGVEIEIPVERWFEVQIPADHFVVLVTSDGAVEFDPEASLPACEGEPPEPGS